MVCWRLNPRLVVTTNQKAQLCHEGVKVIHRDAYDEAYHVIVVLTQF